MADIPFYSKKIESELRCLDATRSQRLKGHYERCLEDWELDFGSGPILVLLAIYARMEKEPVHSPFRRWDSLDFLTGHHEIQREGLKRTAANHPLARARAARTNHQGEGACK